MLDQLYPIGFVVSLIGLILWFYFQKKKGLSRIMSSLFLLGFLVYLVSLAFSSGETGYKLLILCRDLVIITVVSQFFNFFKANTIAFVIMLVILATIIKFSFFNVLQQTFPQHAQQVEISDEWELLLEIENGHDFNEIQGLVDKYGLTFQRAFSPQKAAQTDLDDYYLIGIPDQFESNISSIEKALLKSQAVEWIEENEVIQVDDELVDPIQSTSSGFFLNDPGLKEQWGFTPLDVDRLHRFLVNNNIQPRKKATIAILDTGVDSKHEDIADQFVSIQPKSDNDPRGHGTHCAGIAAAVSNNQLGIASFAPNRDFVQVTSVKVLNANGAGTQKSIIDGIIYAADRGVDVISMSLGGRSNRQKQKAYAEALKYANQAGSILVVAAGNNGADAKNIAPANVPGAITVSATNQQNEKAFFSNHVKNVQMGIAAPGEGIYSTIPNNKYASFNGTSMACPHVSGLVGIMKSIYPELSTKEAFDILDRTGIATKNVAMTGKLIQPYQAVLELLD